MEIFRNFPEKYEIFWTNFLPHITKPTYDMLSCFHVLFAYMWKTDILIFDHILAAVWSVPTIGPISTKLIMAVEWLV